LTSTATMMRMNSSAKRTTSRGTWTTKTKKKRCAIS
jgi:hypothetical protein